MLIQKLQEHLPRQANFYQDTHRKGISKGKVPRVVIGDVSHHHRSLSATSPASVLLREGSGLVVWGFVSSAGSDFASSDFSSGFFS